MKVQQVFKESVKMIQVTWAEAEGSSLGSSRRFSPPTADGDSRMAVTLEVVFRVVKTLCQRRHYDHMTQGVNSLLAHPATV